MKIRPIELFSLTALLAAYVIASVWIQGGGLMMYGEADLFLIDHNTSERSFWNKILCPHQHDADAYLAREITHVVEHIDARFVHWCISHGLIHFMSVSTYGFICAIAGIVWFCTRKAGWNHWLSLAAIAVFLTATPIMFAGIYIRPGHAHATFWAVVTMALIHVLDRQSKWSWLLLFGSSLAMVWADRQGLFMALACSIVFFVTGDWWTRRAAKVMMLAVVAHTSWMVFVGPKLIARFTEFKVGAAYQGEPVIKAVPILMANGWDGFLIALNNVAQLFGGVSLGVAACIVVAAMLTWYFTQWHRESMSMTIGRSKWYLTPPFFFIGFSTVMYGLILHRQAALIWPDLFSSAYYLIFGTTIAWLIAVWYVGLAIHRNRGARRLEWVIGLLMAACVVGNVSGIRGNLTTIKRGHLTGFIAGAPFLKAKLKEVAESPTGTNTNRYDVKASMHFTEFKHIMKNPLEYRQITGDEFAESSQYLQWFRSEKGLPFGKGGRE